MDTVTIRHPDTGHTAVVPASSVATWAKSGWQRYEMPPPLPRRRIAKKPAPTDGAEQTTTDAALAAADPESEN